MISISNINVVSDRKQSLDRTVKGAYRQSLNNALENPGLPSPKIGSVFNTLARNFSIFGLHALICESDEGKAKNFFYMSAISKLRYALEYEKGARSFFSLGFSVSFEAIFCDAVDLYEVYSNVSHPDIESLDDRDSWLTYALTVLYQKSLVADWAGVSDMVLSIESKGLCKTYPCLTGDLEFYKSLCDNDKARVEKSLSLCLSKPSVEFRNKVFKDMALGSFMCHPGMWFAKLAWISGHEIEIEHPLIVSELLPVRPLDSYEVNYKFLDPATYLQ